LPKQRYFSSHAIDLGLPPLFFRCFHCRYRFANAALSSIAGSTDLRT
jgi:hypothetical protein